MQKQYGKPITCEQAKRVMEAAEAECLANEWPAVITIVDSGGNIVMVHRMDNASYGSIPVAEGKARTAINFRGPSAMFDAAFTPEGPGMQLLSIPGLMPIKGAVPIEFDNHIIGAIGTAGMSGDQDEQVSKAGAAALVD